MAALSSLQRSGCFQKRPITLISLKQAGNSVSEQGFDWKRAFQAGFYENAGFQAQNRLYKFGHTVPTPPLPSTRGEGR